MKNKLFITFFAALLAAFCFFTFAPRGNLTTANASTTASANMSEQPVDQNGNFTNLIVFAKFSGESDFLNDSCGKGTTVASVTHNSYELAEYSVKDYYYRVSNGKVSLNNVYLFADGTNSLTLSRERGYYCTKQTDNPIGYESSEYSMRMSELKQDWASAITTAINNGATLTDFNKTKTYTVNDLDKNKDGYIDSITVIYKYSDEYSVSWSDCLWNYQTYSSYLELNNGGKKLCSNAFFQMTANYNFIYRDKNGLEFSSLKTLIHETGHIFGLKDLYKSDSTSPVYYMSAMSNAISPVPQYISAKEREALGWLSPSNVAYANSAGNYTINVTTSETQSSGIICYKREIPELNKTLYLEYRSFTGSANKYDTQQKEIYNQNDIKLKGLSIESGLVCFLVKNGVTFPDNLHGYSSDLDYVALGGQYKTKSDAALMAGESLKIGNDLTINVTEVNDTSLKFTLECTQKECEHSLEKTAYSAPTCTKKGNVEYYVCSLCNKYFLANGTQISLSDTVLDFAPHTEIDLPETYSTCTDHGLTAGKKCSECGTVIKEQTKKPLLDHVESGWITDKEPTYQEVGSKHIECVNCKKVLSTQEIPKKTESETTKPDQGNTTPPTPPDSSDTGGNAGENGGSSSGGSTSGGGSSSGGNGSNTGGNNGNTESDNSGNDADKPNVPDNSAKPDEPTIPDEPNPPSDKAEETPSQPDDNTGDKPNDTTENSSGEQISSSDSSGQNGKNCANFTLLPILSAALLLCALKAFRIKKP